MASKLDPRTISARSGAEVVARLDSNGNYILPEAILQTAVAKARAKRFVYPSSRPEKAFEIQSQDTLTQEQRMRIASNRNQALQRRQMKVSAAENIEPNSQDMNLAGHLGSSKQAADRQICVTEEQRLRIASNRTQALERKKNRASAARSKSDGQVSAAILFEDLTEPPIHFPRPSHFSWRALERKKMNDPAAMPVANNLASTAAIYAEEQVPLPHAEESEEEWEAIALQATHIVESFSNSRTSSPPRSTATTADTSKSREEHSRTPPPRQKRQLYAQTTPLQLPARGRRQASIPAGRADKI